MSDEETTLDSECKEQGKALVSCIVRESKKEFKHDIYVTSVNADVELQREACESQNNKESEFSLANFNELICLWKKD